MSDKSDNALERILESLDRVSSRLDAIIKLQVHELQGNKKTIEMIRLLHDMGCRAPDIAEWLGAPITSVAPIVSRMKAEKRTKKGRR